MQKKPYIFNLSIMKEIEEACDPLYQKGITHFAFLRFFDNETLRLADRKDWLGKFFEKGFYNDQLIFQKEIDTLEFGEEKTLFLTNKPRNKHEKNLIDYGMWHFILKFKRYANYVDFWCCSGEKNNQNILNFYANNMGFLDEFATSFECRLINDYQHNRKNNKIKTSIKIPKKDNKFRVFIRSRSAEKIIQVSPAWSMPKTCHERVYHQDDCL